RASATSYRYFQYRCLFSSRRRHTRSKRDWSSDVCSSELKEKKITAYHETGHAILFHVLPDVGPVHTISIIPTGMGAAGYTMPLPETDEMFNTKGKMLQNIIVALGGRVAEELIFDDIRSEE